MQWSRPFLIAVLVCLSLAITTEAAYAGPFEDGLAASERGDYAEAVKWWRKAAKQGDADPAWVCYLSAEK